MEGKFHPIIPAGSISHIWLGESQPTPESLANFVTKVFHKTLNDQIAFSPEFTTCNDCHRTSRGLQETCAYCDSSNVDGITRITGYFTKTSTWNKGKIGELHERYRSKKFFAAVSQPEEEVKERLIA
jgi:ribonucleoside-triphosphate reductase